jgi:hypothetical protein
VKLTDSLHHPYFTTSMTTRPFPHAAIHLGTGRWVVTALSYALSAIGFYLLCDAERLETGRDSARRVVGMTALPVVFHLFGPGEGSLLTLNCEPLGVAAFAVGALYVVDSSYRDGVRIVADDVDVVRSAPPTA